MKKDLGITKGKWECEDIKGYPRFNDLPKIKVNGNLIAEMGGGELSIVESNAKLIADSGNTAQKCGLLPSQLLEQRDELLKLVKEWAHRYPNSPWIYDEASQLIEKCTS